MAGNAIKYDIQELLNREYDKISMGITPSGNSIHPGTLYTIALPLIYLSKHPDIDVEICVTDLDFDNRVPLSVPYYLAKTGRIPNKERTKYEIRSAVDIYADILEIDESTIKENVEISIFSEKMKDNENMLELFKKIALDEQILLELKRIWLGSKKKKRTLSKVPYSIICPSCNLLDAGYATINRHDETLKKKCKNSYCKEDIVVVSLDDVGSYALHYIIPPVKDILVSDESRDIIHVFGGDYDIAYGAKGMSKYKIIQNMMALLTENPPDVYIGAMVTVDGKKMSKSNRDTTHLFKDIDSGQWHNELEQIINTLMTTESKTIEFSGMHS